MDPQYFAWRPYRLGLVESAIIYTLTYFSIFRHPLRCEELQAYLQFCSEPVQDLRPALHALTRAGLIGNVGEFYFLAGEEDLVQVRKQRSLLAQHWLPHISSAARFVASLPFVRAVALTGSLSKGTQEPGGDIDLMLVCAPGRLWTAQLFIGLTRRLGRLLRQFSKWGYCTNYILASDYLKVEKQNLFTATEIAFVRPLVNAGLCAEFFSSNEWIREYYPRWRPPTEQIPEPRTNVLKRVIEWAFAGKVGQIFEQKFGDWMHTRIKRKNERAGRALSEQRRHPSEIVLHHRSRQKDYEAAWRSALEEFQTRNDVRLVNWLWSYQRTGEHCNASEQPAPGRPSYLRNVCAPANPI